MTTKAKIKLISYCIASCLIAYAIMAFVNWNINIKLWTNLSRFLYLIITIPILVLITEGKEM